MAASTRGAGPADLIPPPWRCRRGNIRHPADPDDRADRLRASQKDHKASRVSCQMSCQSPDRGSLAALWQNHHERRTAAERLWVDMAELGERFGRGRGSHAHMLTTLAVPPAERACMETA